MRAAVPSLPTSKRSFPMRSTSIPGTWLRSRRSRAATPSVSETRVPFATKKLAVWAQDDWQIVDRLTLNLGVRYDVGIGLFANDISFPPFQEAGRPDDWNNVQPRLGFAFKLNDRTVIRGGTGLYYGDAGGNDQASSIGNRQITLIRYENDGRPDFTANPTNGRPVPTSTRRSALLRANGNAPGCLIRDVREFTALPQYIQLPRTWQTSIGFQRQLGDTMAIEVDYVYYQGRFEKDVIDTSTCCSIRPRAPTWISGSERIARIRTGARSR